MTLTSCRIVDYIPHDLEEQTKVLLRLTMESPLTVNVSQLSDLGTGLDVDVIHRRVPDTYTRMS